MPRYAANGYYSTFFYETQKTFTGCVLRLKVCILWEG